MHTNLAISLNNVSKYYKLYANPRDRLKESLSFSGEKFHTKFYATKHVDLNIRKGEILGIVGKNGSGKSTLLKLITNVLSPDEGSIEINGKISALLELGSGFNPEFTGFQNIAFYGTILGFSKKEMDEKIDDIIAFADIGTFMDQPLKTYSSGMKSRLAFSVAVHVEPEILILDEVLSVGDIHFKRKAYNKMQTFFESGKTIIYVSHSSGEVNRLCSRAIMLHDGEILMDAEPKEVTKYYEKYLFAKDENKQNIVNEIKSYQVSVKLEDKKNTKAKNTTAEDSAKSKLEAQAYCISDFVSKNRVEYDNTFLTIDNIHLETMEGETVNVLVNNERYIFCYTLSFLADFNNVDFGMQIYTEKGVLISGAKNETSLEFKAGESVEIKWDFDCLMHAGTYYTSIGVNQLRNDKREYINRIVDALVFKVLPIENFSNGLVYLKQAKPKILKLN